MRKKIVAGNWKMNLDSREANLLFEELNNYPSFEGVDLIIAPPSIYLDSFSKHKLNIHLAAQNVSAHLNGAYTGQISSSMLSAMNLNYCIVGHSERRIYNNESNEQIFQKAKSLLDHNIQPILCCGELLEDREAGDAFKVVEQQLSLELTKFTKQQMSKVIVAYEPVWAIGTGVTASSDDAQQMHQFIRTLISTHFDNQLANEISILYGGSCKPDNAKELFSQNDIDGGLIGGASLKFDSFISIAKSF
ncbi:MAG: triose-phosphate isomerase [Parvicellaceae bacterium]